MNLLSVYFRRSVVCTVFPCLLLACNTMKLTVVNQLAKWGDYQYQADLSYGDDSRQRLDIYIPNEDAGCLATATIIFFYGGCWGGCKVYSKEYYRFVAQSLTTLGYSVVVPDYRLYPQVLFPQLMQDAAKAVTWVIQNNVNNGDINPRIFLMGHSAGAHIAAMLTLNEHYLAPEVYSKIKGFIGLAGPYDFLPLTKAYQRAVFAPPEQYPASQPINFVDGSEPPMLLLHGTEDTLVKAYNSRSLAEKTIALGGIAATRFYTLQHEEILAALSIPLRNSYPVLEDVNHFILNTLSDSRCGDEQE